MFLWYLGDTSQKESQVTIIKYITIKIKVLTIKLGII